jgi:hypothetical protein
MSQWESAYAASGLAASNTQLYIGLGLIVYMYLAVYFLQFFFPKKSTTAAGEGEGEGDTEPEVRWKMAKLKEEEMKQKFIEDFVFSLQKDLRAGRLVSVLSLFLPTPFFVFTFCLMRYIF